MESNLKLSWDNDLPLEDHTPYRRLIGRLIYLTLTCPDIAFSIQVLSQYMDNPQQPHMDATSRVLRYLKNTPGQGIFFFNPSSSDLYSKLFVIVIERAVVILDVLS
jgi:hypothetical protein